jgi:LmbE family N-acetylglucosaminyl deacetylase
MLRSVVCFFAHPDDETILAGGIIHLLVQQRIPVHIVCATRGEGGELGEPPVVPRRELLGAAREAELRCAAQQLGASVETLAYIDPTIGEDEALYPFEADLDRLTAQFMSIARQRQASLLLTHGADGEYGHPAHRLVNQAVLHGAQHLLPRSLVYSVAALVPDIEDRLWNRSEPAHLALDIRPWGAVKLAAMACHRSQHALFLRRKNLKSLAEALRTVESVRRQWPPVRDETPRDAFANLLRTAGAWEPQARP